MIREQLANYYLIKDRPGTFGIEIETEAESYDFCYPKNFLKSKVISTPQGDKGGYHIPKMPYWEGHEDGSLRDFGVEYVLKEPLSFDETLKALEEFRRETAEVKFSHGGAGTSVHVHINVGKETFLTLGNFLTLYTLFENVLVEFSGPQRRSNLFALPTRCAERTINNIVRMFKGIEKGDGYACSFNIETVKYAALNLAPICYFGSVEIRSFRGSTDADEIAEWIRVLNRLIEYAKNPALTPKIIILEWRDRGPEFFDDVFGEEAKLLKKLLISRGQPLLDMVDYNLWYASEIAGSVNDWSTISTKITDVRDARKKAAKKMPEKVAGKVAKAVLIDDFGMLHPPQPNPIVWVNDVAVAAQIDLDNPEPEGDF